MEKLPPEEKIIEALTALADGRVKLDGDGHTATVESSDGTKTYTVSWSAEGREFRSNDNATYWRGYAGYPVIAVLMLLGRLPYPVGVAEQLKEIPWKALNTKHHNDYRAALAEAAAERHLSVEEIVRECEPVMEALRALPVTVRRGVVKPPK